MIQSLNEMKTIEGRDLDPVIQQDTLLGGETVTGNFGALSMGAVKNFTNQGVTDSCVKTEAQTLSDAEKTQARTNIGAAEENAQYKAGDVVPLRVIVSNGYITSSQSNIHFDLILRKEVPSNLKVNLSGIVSIRENGYYLMPAQNMAGTDLGFEVSDSSITVTSYVSTNGVKIVLAVPKWYRQNSSTVAENNFPVSVNITSGTLTFPNL